MSRRRYELILRAAPMRGVPATVRLRHFLKAAWRKWALRCESVREVLVPIDGHQDPGQNGRHHEQNRHQGKRGEKKAVGKSEAESKPVAYHQRLLW
jgi:hypothetical protein